MSGGVLMSALAILAGNVAVGVLAFLAGRKARKKPSYPQPIGDMKPGEIRAALRVGDDHPLWRAVHQLLGGQIEALVEEATDADNLLRPPLPAYYAGAARHLERFRGFLVEERAEAMKEAEEEE